MKIPKIILAPMAGVTDRPFRELCVSYGAEATISEMVSAKGLCYDSKKTISLMQRGKTEKLYGIQIFGSEPDFMARAVPLVSDYCDFIDINMGCPAPKIVSNGDGSALLKDLKLLYKVAKNVVDASSKPVTAKIRAGWDANSIVAVEAAKALEQAGVCAITVHGRTRDQFYSGTADWNIIKLVKNAVGVSVIGNGDIFSAEDALHMLNETGCDGVMIARGAEGNPFIFEQVSSLLYNNKVINPPSIEERINTAIAHVEGMVADTDEEHAVREARKHLAWYIKGVKNATRVKPLIFQAKTLVEVRQALSELL